MRLDLLLEPFSALGVLWGALSGPLVCTSSSQALSGAARTTGRAAAWSAPADVVAFIDVNVVPMDTERVLANHTVLVEGGQITALGPSATVKVPAAATRIDGRGKYLIPGLGNMHPHGGLSDTPLQSPLWQSLLVRELAGGVTTLRHIAGGDLTPKQLRTYVETADLRMLAAAAQRAGLWITPTLQCSEGRAVSPAHVQLLRKFVKVLLDGKVGLLLAGDDKWDVHDELSALVHAGLTPYEALVTGTRNVAAFYKLLDSSGTVAVGKRADLVLLSGNPLRDIRHTREPAGVMLAGRWFDRAALDQHLLAFPENWFQSIWEARSVTHLLDEGQRDKLRKHGRDLRALSDSLAKTQPKSPAYEGGLQRIAEKLGAMRGVLTTPEQRKAFDLKARVWLREQARQGYQVAIPSVALVP